MINEEEKKNERIGKMMNEEEKIWGLNAKFHNLGGEENIL